MGAKKPMQLSVMMVYNHMTPCMMLFIFSCFYCVKLLFAYVLLCCYELIQVRN